MIKTLNVKLISHSEGRVKREHVSALIYKYLSTYYHDNGVGQHHNGRPVKVHTFAFRNNTEYKNGDLIEFEARGIDIIINKLQERMKVLERVKLGNVQATIIMIDEKKVKLYDKVKYKILTPTVVKLSNKREEVSKDWKLWGRNYYLTPEHDQELWENEIDRKLIYKAKILYGDDIIDKYGNPNVKVYKSHNVSPRLFTNNHEVKMQGMKGLVNIEGHTFWKEFAYLTGIGEHVAYGFGVLEVLE